MSKVTKKPASSDDGYDLKQALLIWGTVADTTWRMFVPVLSLSLVGYWLDGAFHTRPTLVITGMVVGIVVAVVLVAQQYLSVKKGNCS